MRITRLYEDIFREMKGSVKKCGAFIKISTIFEDFSDKLRLFQGFHGCLYTF
jgi:hypothetical protein